MPYAHSAGLQFVFIDNKLLLPKGFSFKSNECLPLSLPDFLIDYQTESLGLTSSSKYGKHYLLDLHHVEISDLNYELIGLRDLLMSVPDEEFQFIAQAWQFALFLRTHRFCGRCGNPTRRVNWEMAVHCDKCQHRAYPRVSPCIIVAIHNDDKILLAQGVRHQNLGFYSTLAGFVESAESLEQAIHREVKEEVGVNIGEVEYFGSQPWPFPHSIMVGYIAKYQSGDILIDEKEIVDAQWFDIDELPKIPGKFSIAGRLIEETVNRIKQNRGK